MKKKIGMIGFLYTYLYANLKKNTIVLELS